MKRWILLFAFPIYFVVYASASAASEYPVVTAIEVSQVSETEWVCTTENQTQRALIVPVIQLVPEAAFEIESVVVDGEIVELPSWDLELEWPDICELSVTVVRIEPCDGAVKLEIWFCPEDYHEPDAREKFELIPKKVLESWKGRIGWREVEEGILWYEILSVDLLGE